nr:MAG TPA: hypothetical protein [Caudoviricetes sp.]DAR49415.1 MAG TPA: hypothetical protein [Caudoviricetes sp.]
MPFFANDYPLFAISTATLSPCNRQKVDGYMVSL